MPTHHAPRPADLFGPLPGSGPDGPDLAGGWVAVVPLKSLDDAKSRLAPLGDVARRELAVAMASDTVAACVAALGRGRVCVVTSDPALAERMSELGARVVPDPGTGLNDAVRAGADHARSGAPEGGLPGVVAVVGDLPCLEPADLRTVLAVAAGRRRAFVPDAQGTGTVLVTAGPGVPIEPRFGRGSAARHLEIATPLDAPGRLRLDVDDVEAWQRARAAGPGPRSCAVATRFSTP